MSSDHPVRSPNDQRPFTEAERQRCLERGRFVSKMRAVLYHLDPETADILRHGAVLVRLTPEEKRAFDAAGVRALRALRDLGRTNGSEP